MQQIERSLMYSHRSINSGTIQGGGCQTDEIPDDNSLISEEETCKVYPIKKRSLPIIEESEKQIDQQAQPTKEHQENKLEEEHKLEPPPRKKAKNLGFRIRDY